MTKDLEPDVGERCIVMTSEGPTLRMLDLVISRARTRRYTPQLFAALMEREEHERAGRPSRIIGDIS
jgi:hypothetical protein